MPRQARPDLPGVPQHLMQRGNDRQPRFFADIDRMRYLLDLRELSVKLGIAVHAYVLMTNHVHLLLTSHSTGAIATLMQSLGRRYVRYINDLQRQHARGNDRFRDAIERQLGRRAGPAARMGRPPKVRAKGLETAL